MGLAAGELGYRGVPASPLPHFGLQERKLQLVFESLMQEPWGNGEQCSVLRALAGRRLGAALAPGRR